MSYVARQLGHGAELTMRVYGHVIEALEDLPQLPAEEAIGSAREPSVPVQPSLLPELSGDVG